MFLSPTYYGVWLFISLFIGFCVGDSNRNTASIKQRSHIKSIFVNMLFIKLEILGILDILGLSLL